MRKPVSVPLSQHHFRRLPLDLVANSFLPESAADPPYGSEMLRQSTLNATPFDFTIPSAFLFTLRFSLSAIGSQLAGLSEQKLRTRLRYALRVSNPLG